jgi:hypothetical protein
MPPDRVATPPGDRWFVDAGGDVDDVIPERVFMASIRIDATSRKGFARLPGGGSRCRRGCGPTVEAGAG